MLPKLLKMWQSVIDTLYNISVLLTFLGIIPTLIFMYYYLFKQYDPIRVLVSGIIVVILIHSNKSIQGGRF